MRKMKKGVALALTATMVLGSTVTAFAADTNSGTSTGTGTPEGHVEKKATKVVLPVENTDYESSTFSYIMDPERLISGTSGGKYADGATFPASASDTGVYFQTGTTTYDNASKELKVTNQSSHNIDLTVKAEAVSAATDIPLVAKDAIATAENASLYLGLAVGDGAAGVAINKDAVAQKTVSVPGKEGNFKVAVKEDKSGYEYRALSLDEYKALDSANASATELPWEATKFKLEGSVTKDKTITDATTAPQVKVTWSWVDPSAEAAPSIATTSYTMTAGTALDIPVNLGVGDKKATGVSKVMYGTIDQLAGGYVTYSDGKITVTSTCVNYLKSQGGTQTLKVIFNDTAETSVDVTLQ